MSNHDNQKRVCIGKVAGAHGVKGLVKIKPFCDDLTLLNGELFIDKTGQDILTVTLKNPSGKYIIAQAEEITTREQAGQTKCSLYILREQLPETEEDEFYHEDLIGLVALEANQEIGAIKAIENFGASDLMEIKPKNGNSYFIPFDDQYIEDINLDEKTIHLKNTKHFILD